MTGSAADRAESSGEWREILLDRWRVAQDRSIVGPGDPHEHLALAVVLAQVLEEPQIALDLGSGAGIPGLALAGLWPESAWILVDAARRRVRLLEDSVDALGWGSRITVVHGRAEDLARDPALRGSVDLVTSRSFGPPAVVAECGAPFLRVGGILAVTEPPDSAGGRWPQAGLDELGLVVLGVRQGVQRLRADRMTPSEFPRRAGVPEKRPRF